MPRRDLEATAHVARGWVEHARSRRFPGDEIGTRESSEQPGILCTGPLTWATPLSKADLQRELDVLRAQQTASSYTRRDHDHDKNSFGSHTSPGSMTGQSSMPSVSPLFNVSNSRVMDHTSSQSVDRAIGSAVIKGSKIDGCRET